MLLTITEYRYCCDGLGCDAISPDVSSPELPPGWATLQGVRAELDGGARQFRAILCPRCVEKLGRSGVLWEKPVVWDDETQLGLGMEVHRG